MQVTQNYGFRIPTFEEFLNFFGDHVLVQAAAAIGLSVILGKIVVMVLSRGLGQLARRTRIDIDDQLIRMLRHPVFTSIVLSGFATALKLLALPQFLENIGLGLIGTLVALIWLIFGINVTILILRWMSQHPERFNYVQPPTLPLFEIVAKVVLVGAGAYFVFLAWGIDVTAWMASAGIVGIAVGFAAKDTLANLFAGVSILADAPYKVGDVIVLDQDRGVVTKIGIRSTRILTRDDIEITIPNATMGNSKIINESGGPSVKRRVRIGVGVAYGSDVDQVRAILEDCARGHSMVAPEPEPRVRMRAFGDSSLDFELLCWITDPMMRGMVTDDILTLVYKRFTAEGVTIPFPQRDLHIKQWPQSLPQGAAPKDTTDGEAV